MARKTKQESLKTRDIILNTATEVLLTRGVEQTKLADIAQLAGVTRGAIYWHFSNKYSLLKAIWEDLIEKKDFIFQITANDDESDPLGLLVKQLQLFIEKIPENEKRRRLFHLLIADGITSCQKHQFHFDQLTFIEKRIQDVSSLLSLAIDKGQLSKNIDIVLYSIVIIEFAEILVPRIGKLSSDLSIHVDHNELLHMLICAITR